MEANIKQALMQFMKDHLNVELRSASVDLVEDGILDSLMLIELVMFMETEFSVTAELDDLEIENFVSVDKMACFVAARQLASMPAGEQAAPAIDGRGS